MTLPLDPRPSFLDPILTCNNVSIRYMVGDFKAIGLKEWVVRRLTGNYKVNEFWADRDITFSLDKGDMLGIIGTNGIRIPGLFENPATMMILPAGGFLVMGFILAAIQKIMSGKEDK